MLGVLYIIGCPVQLIGEVFSRLHSSVVVDTHLPRFEALAYVLPLFDALTHVVIRVSSAFIFQTFAEVCYSVFVNRSSFKSVLKVNTLSKILLWIIPSYFSLENACYSWYVHQTGLFSSASVVPQSKFTGELCSSAAVIPQSKSSEMWSSAAPFHHDLWYFRHWTNEHFSSMLFIRQNVTTVAPLKLLKSIHSTIVNWVEWLWNPSDSFVICFCGPESAQRSKEFLSFWLYWPIKTLH